VAGIEGARAAAGRRLVEAKHRIRTAHPLGHGMRRTLAELDHAPATVLRDFQDRRLRSMVRWAAARSPFYRDWFAEHRVDPRDVRTVTDLPVLPLIDRSVLLEQGASRFLAYPARLTWPAYSSGTSGHGVVEVRRTPGSSVYELAALQRQWSWFGLRPDVRRLVLREAGADPGPDGSAVQEVPGANQLKVSAYDLGRVDTDRLLADVRAWGPGAVEGWPSAIAALAHLLEERGERLPVGGVITSSEVVPHSQRLLLESVFEAPVIDHYGQTERVSMAGTCEALGYHLFDDYAVTELLGVDGDDLGAREIVGTPLHNWAFPLFRYRTGDTVGQDPAGECTCGRSHQRIGPVAGRAEDRFTAADGRPLPMPSAVFDGVLGLRESQIAQLAPGRFAVRLAMRPGVRTDDVVAEVRGNIDRLFGPGQDLEVTVHDHVPRSPSGKLRPSVVLGPR